MKINIFRNPFIDAQVGFLIDSYEDGLRKQTESYWRKVIDKEYEDLLNLEYWRGYNNGYIDGYTDSEEHCSDEVLREP
jgi:hypothetical protein